MTKEQRQAFIAWAENEAHGAIYADGDQREVNNRRIEAGFDAMRTVFPEDEDWLGDVWDRLMR
jgi:hypothetical protein